LNRSVGVYDPAHGWRRSGVANLKPLNSIERRYVMLSRNLKVLSASALLLLAVSSVQAADVGTAQDPVAQKVPCKPDNSNCPWKSGGKGSGTIVATPQPTSAAGNPCKPGGSSTDCLKWINGKVTIKPKPKN
jgi:hypothetical protein